MFAIIITPTTHSTNDQAGAADLQPIHQSPHDRRDMLEQNGALQSIAVQRSELV